MCGATPSGRRIPTTFGTCVRLTDVYKRAKFHLYALRVFGAVRCWHFHVAIGNQGRPLHSTKRTANQIVLPCFLPSVIGCTDLCRGLLLSRLQSMIGSFDRHFIDTFEQWKRRTPAIPPFDQRQKKMGLALVEATLSLLLNTAPNQAAVARLSAVSAQHAGAFLQAIPINAIGTRMDDKSLRIAVALRLALNISVYEVLRWTSTGFTVWVGRSQGVA